MALKALFEEVENDILDVIQTTFEYTDTNFVPNRSEPKLTFERREAKKGQKLKTCVLFVDIRNSVSLTEKHHTQTMGRIYTAFSKTVLKIAKYHSGHIRNIIGDRIMVVFPAQDCFRRAIDCAISINHASKIINKKFQEVDFKCGIGIDYGELRVIKVGIQRQGQEGTENKSLVWVGYPANIASRLTDNANKSVSEIYYEVIRNPVNPRSIPTLATTLAIAMGIATPHKTNEPYYLSTTETIEMTPEEFAGSINSIKDGELYMTGGQFIKFTKKTRIINYPNILITNNVFNEYKTAYPQNKDVTNNFWKEQKHSIKNVNGKIFGCDITWIIN